MTPATGPPAAAAAWEAENRRQAEILRCGALATAAAKRRERIAAIRVELPALEAEVAAGKARHAAARAAWFADTSGAAAWLEYLEASTFSTAAELRIGSLIYELSKLE